MKSRCKMILRMLILVVGSAVLGTALLSLCFLVPVSNARVAETQAIFESEGWYPDVLRSGSGNSFETFLTGVLDNSSDYIMFTTATDCEGVGNPLERALRMHSVYLLCEYGKIGLLSF